MQLDRSIQHSDRKVCRALRLITGCLCGYPQSGQGIFECMKAISKSSPAPELAQGGGYPAQSPQRDEPRRYLFLGPYLQKTRRPQLHGTKALGNLRELALNSSAQSAADMQDYIAGQTDGLACMQMQLLRGTGACVGMINCNKQVCCIP